MGIARYDILGRNAAAAMAAPGYKETGRKLIQRLAEVSCLGLSASFPSLVKGFFLASGKMHHFMKYVIEPYWTGECFDH